MGITRRGHAVAGSLIGFGLLALTVGSNPVLALPPLPVTAATELVCRDWPDDDYQGVRCRLVNVPNNGGSSGGSPTRPTRPVDPCVWTWGTASGGAGIVAGLAVAPNRGAATTRDVGGETEYLQVRICRPAGRSAYLTNETRWATPGTPPDPDPSGTIQRLELLDTFEWEPVAPTLSPEDPERQILYLPTWISIADPALYTETVSIPNPWAGGALAGAVATPIGIRFDPGNGEEEIYCDSLGVEWTYGDDERLDNNPNAIPDACRFEFEELPENDGRTTAQIGLRYSITYTGLTQPLDNGTMTEEYDPPLTPLPMRVREQVAVNVSGSSDGARSTN
jgi:hypothetical protein